MRVTDQNLFSNVQKQLQATKSKFERSSIAVSSGRKIDRLEDDPLVLQQSMRNSREEANLEQFSTTIMRQTDRYKVYDTKFNESYEVLSRLKSIMVQLANPHMEDDTRTELRTELEHINDQLLMIANTEHDGQYIFSGARTDVEAFDGNGVYQGDTIVQKVEILPGIKMERNVTGDRMFGGVGYDNGVNIFEIIGDIDTALDGNPQAVSADYLDEIDQAIEQTIQERIVISTRLARLEMSTNTLEQLKLSLSERRAATEDVDYITAITDFKAQEYALNATMEVNSRLIRTSLLGYLR